MNCREFNAGDHLAAGRIIYRHHGLYVGQGRVIHYDKRDGRPPRIQMASFEDFADGHEVKRIEHPDRLYDPRESILRAESKLGRADYNLAFRNCEHFVNWCVEGREKSGQVRGIVTGFVAVLGLIGSAVVLGGRRS